MARPRKVFPPSVEAELRARLERGESAATVHSALRGVVPLATIGRRQKELRAGNAPGGVCPPRASPGLPPAVPSAGDVPDSVPPDASEEDLDAWIRRLQVAVAKAETQENWAAVASLTAKYTALTALKHKHAPLPIARPEDNPDYAALAAMGEERLLRLVEGLFNEQPGLPSEITST